MNILSKNIRFTVSIFAFLATTVGAQTSASSLPASVTLTVKRYEKTLQIPRKSFGAVLLDGQIFSVGGHGGTRHSTEPQKLLRSSEWLHLQSGSIEEGRPLPLPIYGFETVLYDNNFVYAFGGLSYLFDKKNAPAKDPVHRYSSRLIERYNQQHGQWEIVPHVTLSHPRSSHIVKLVGDKAYVIGGWDFRGSGWGREGEGVYVHEVDVVDLAKLELSPVNLKLPAPERRAFCGVTTDDGRIIMAGGMTPDPEDSDQPKTVTQVTVLNPENSQQPWSELPSMPVGLFGPGCAFVNGVFLVFGGAALAEQGMNYQTAIYAFDLKNFAAGWNKLGDLGEAKGFVQAVVTENKVFVLGGTKTEEKSPVAGPNDAIEIIEVTRLN